MSIENVLGKRYMTIGNESFKAQNTGGGGPTECLTAPDSTDMLCATNLGLDSNVTGAKFHQYRVTNGSNYSLQTQGPAAIGTEVSDGTTITDIDMGANLFNLSAKETGAYSAEFELNKKKIQTILTALGPFGIAVDSAEPALRSLTMYDASGNDSEIKQEPGETLSTITTSSGTASCRQYTGGSELKNVNTAGTITALINVDDGSGTELSYTTASQTDKILQQNGTSISSTLSSGAAATIQTFPNQHTINQVSSGTEKMEIVLDKAVTDTLYIKKIKGQEVSAVTLEDSLLQLYSVDGGRSDIVLTPTNITSTSSEHLLKEVDITPHNDAIIEKLFSGIEILAGNTHNFTLTLDSNTTYAISECSVIKTDDSSVGINGLAPAKVRSMKLVTPFIFTTNTTFTAPSLAWTHYDNTTNSASVLTNPTANTPIISWGAASVTINVRALVDDTVTSIDTIAGVFLKIYRLRGLT